MIAVNTGYEIQIDDMAAPDGNPLHKTGAIYNIASPSDAAVSKPIGQWNTFEIEITNQKYSVMLNGKKVIPEFYKQQTHCWIYWNSKSSCRFPCFI